MKTLFIALAASALCACAMPQPGMRGQGFLGAAFSPSPAAAESAEDYVDESVYVITEPAGARIHVNDVFAGYAPVRYDVRRFWRGDPGHMVLDSVKVEALPVAGGQCVQSGIYGGGSNRVPSPVTFDMTACAPQAK